MLLVPALSLGDLPVHCLHTQVRGRWRFHLGQLAEVSGEPPRCGHHLPGTKDDEMADPRLIVPNATTFDVTLSDPDVATDASGQSGFWTMVYDEGFEVRIGDRVFFAFSRFRASHEPKDNAPLAPKELAGFASECTRSAPGWYSETGRSRWGCYYAEQLEAAAPPVEERGNSAQAFGAMSGTPIVQPGTGAGAWS